MSASVENDLKHHKRFEYCTNRLKYRDGKKLTAVKVYTAINESRHLLVFGVPKINLRQEVRRLFEKYGAIHSIQIVTNQIAVNPTVEIEQFTDSYYILYEKIHCARRSKLMLDRKSFYGGILHISYAPEYETVDDVRNKLEARKSDVEYRLRKIHTQNQLPQPTMGQRGKKRNLKEVSTESTTSMPTMKIKRQ